MKKQIVHLFVFNTLADWETGYAVAGINNPDMQKQLGRYQIQTVGLKAEPVTTIGKDEGAPRGRSDYSEPYYGCLVRDSDGHKIEAAF